MPLIDPSLLNPLLGAAAGRLDVDSVAQCDSTNSQLMARAAQGAPVGSVLVADEQSAGRGRRGRTWLSSPEDSLTFSLLWRIPAPATRISGLSLAVGLALAQAMVDLGVTGAKLKWPNDLLLLGPKGEAKLAGILVELSMDRRGTQAVVGIGLNLRAPRADVGQAVAGLADGVAALPDRHAILAALLSRLVRVLDRFCDAGFAALRDEWQACHAWQDRQVRVLDEGRVVAEGLCRGADDDGALLIETATGIERILVGELSVRPFP